MTRGEDQTTQNNINMNRTPKLTLLYKMPRDSQDSEMEGGRVAGREKGKLGVYQSLIVHSHSRPLTNST